MAIKFSQFKKTLRTTEVEWDGEKVTLHYRPGEITPHLGEIMSDPENKQPLVGALVSILTGWDVLDDDSGLPMPIDEALLMDMPTPFLEKCLQKCYEASMPGKA